MNYIKTYSSPIGDIDIIASESAVTGLYLPNHVSRQGKKPENQGFFPPDQVRCDTELLRMAANWLDRYFAGEAPASCELPVSEARSTFERSVRQILLSIPYGAALSYGEVAHRIAELYEAPYISPRAVGGAAARNEIAIIVPCHRVIGADGSLRGYNGGVAAKKWLLRHEGFLL